MKKPKQKHKTRAELVAELNKNKDFRDKMIFTKEVFYPALAKATASIDDAIQNLSIINTVIMEKFLGFMKDKKMSELKITESLSKEDPKYHDLKYMIELFDDYTVFDAKDIFEGMRGEIQLFVTEENKSRTLLDLKRQWIDEL